MEIKIVQELSGRYLKVFLEEGSGGLGTEMLSYNEVEGVLGAEIHHVDETDWYFYSVHDWIPLSELFEKNRLTTGQLSAVLKQLEGIVKRCQEYFLDEKNLLLLSDYMFYDEKASALKIAYLDGYGKEVADGLSKLLERFMDSMNHSDKDLVFFVYGMHRIVRDRHFTLSRLIDFIGEQKESDQEHKEKRSADPSPDCSPPAQPVQRQQPEKPVIKYAKAAGIVVAGILLFILVLKSGLLSQPVSGEIDLKKAAVLAVVLFGVEGYFLEKILGSKENKGARGKEEREDRTTMLVSTYSDETVVLESVPNTKWIVNLVPKDWQRREINIKKSPFFIGKDAAKVDGVISEGDVSRIHAKIVADEDGVFLIDQESTNGTFVNGARVVPWERCQIKNGDMIGFSSIYYKAELYQ